jgi:cellulose synthase/poly-beta-1,6-N-acetylglucosamine synthase-like glycosyltransferase
MVYLSIIVPVRNEEKYIVSTLDALIHQDYHRQRYELLVVDGRSTDQTRNVVREFIKNHPDVNIKLLENPGQLSSRGRNIGVRNAKGILIGVIDGHVYIPNDQLFANIERLKDENVAVCLARPQPLSVPRVNGGKEFWIAVARASWLGHSRNSFIYSNYSGFVDPTSSGFAYERSVFERVGYFDESFDAAEDVEFNYRVMKAGHEAYTSPDLLIYYYPRKTLKALFTQQVRYGEGRAKFVLKHPGGFTKETLIPAGILIFFAFGPLAVALQFIFPAISFAYTAILITYFAILFFTGSTEALKRKRLMPGLLVAMAIYITHLGLGFGFLKAFISDFKRFIMLFRKEYFKKMKEYFHEYQRK